MKTTWLGWVMVRLANVSGFYNCLKYSQPSSCLDEAMQTWSARDIAYYYMEESVVLGTKPLVDSIRHFIRDPSGIFSVCHLCECRIIKWRHGSRLWFYIYAFVLCFIFSLHIIKRTLHVGSKIWILCSCVQEQYLTCSLRSLVRYCPCHSNIKFISSRHRVYIVTPKPLTPYVSLYNSIIDILRGNLEVVGVGFRSNHC